MLSILTPNKSNQKLDSILNPIKPDLQHLEVLLNKDLTSGNADLDRIVSYVFGSGGKRLRPALVMLFSKALNPDKELSREQIFLAQAVEMIHTATLVHDDVIDDAETRRGVLTVGKKWGAKTAIVAGDFILSKALSKLVPVGYMAVETFSGTLSELCVGEILQKNQKYKVITMDEYINKSERKTAKLFMAGVESVVMIMPDSNNLIINGARGYAQNYGIAFQIKDDILNFTKSGGVDLKDGIITAPVIYAVQEYEEKGDTRLRKLIEAGLKKDKDFKAAMKLVLSSGGMEKARELANKYTQRAITSLEMMEDNSYIQTLISLAEYTVERN